MTNLVFDVALLRMLATKKIRWITVLCAAVFVLIVSIILVSDARRLSVIRAGIVTRKSGNAKVTTPHSHSHIVPETLAVNKTANISSGGAARTVNDSNKANTSDDDADQEIQLSSGNHSAIVPPRKTLKGYVSMNKRSNHLHLNCSKCAYVSSSGQLRGKGAGHLIDSFPCVIRMNDAPTRGYEQDVGNKTTIRMVAFSSMQFVYTNREILFQGSGKSEYFLIWGPPSAMDSTKPAYDVAQRLSKEPAAEGLKIFLMSLEQYNFAHHLYENETQISIKKTNAWLSTGWFTMLFAREACDEIHVFGLVPHNHCKNNKNSNVPYHYYKPNGILECSEYSKGDRLNVGGHHLNLEKTVFARWSKLEPNIYFSQPEWLAF